MILAHGEDYGWPLACSFPGHAVLNAFRLWTATTDATDASGATRLSVQGPVRVKKADKINGLDTRRHTAYFTRHDACSPPPGGGDPRGAVAGQLARFMLRQGLV